MQFSLCTYYAIEGLLYIPTVHGMENASILLSSYAMQDYLVFVYMVYNVHLFAAYRSGKFQKRERCAFRVL